MCSRQELFPVIRPEKVSTVDEEITLPQFPEQFSTELAAVWLRCISIFSDNAAAVILNILYSDNVSWSCDTKSVLSASLADMFWKFSAAVYGFLSLLHSINLSFFPFLL